MADEMYASRRLSSLSSMNLLAQLPSECLHLIIQSCDFYDLMALELAGDRSLSRKLERSISQIDAQIAPIFKWTFLPFRYRNLRSLSINMLDSFFENPFLVPNDRLLPFESHNTLEELRIRSPLAMTLLHNDATYLPLSTLLPMLKKLKIFTDGRVSLEMLHNVCTVTYLQLQLSDLPEGDCPTSILKYLPKGLQTLKLSVNLAKDPAEAGNEINFISFPPALTSLSICVRDPISALKALPTTLRQLKMTFNCEESPQINVSHFPPNLTYLSFDTYSCFPVLLMDDSFPYSLTSLALPAMVSFQSSETREKLLDISAFLPPSITDLDIPADFFNTMEVPNRVSKVFYRATTKMNSFDQMSNLKDLSAWCIVFNSIQLNTLPAQLTRLQVKVDNRPEWQETFVKLPNLSDLSLDPGSASLSIESWNHLCQRLQYLGCSISSFTSIKTLGDLPWTKLKYLALYSSSGAIPPSDFMEAFQDGHCSTMLESNPVRYPPTLERITTVGFRYARLLWPPISLLSKLQSLNFVDSPGEGVHKLHNDQSLYNFFLTLPPSLRELSAHVPYYIEPRFLWSLPRGLKSLRLQNGYDLDEIAYTEDVDPAAFLYQGRRREAIKTALWTEQHLLCLPPRIQILNLRGLQMFHLERFSPKSSGLLPSSPPPPSGASLLLP